MTTRLIFLILLLVVSSVSSADADPPGYYTVKVGDTLNRIALDSGRSISDLMQWNALSSPNALKVGQVLRVIPPHDSQSTDSKNALMSSHELNNPKMLPPCPKADMSRQQDWERTEKWDACWGRYEIETNIYFKNFIYEGSWKNGALDGLGVEISNAGEKYIGEFKNGLKNGLGKKYLANGVLIMGVWDNDNFIRAAKVNLPDLIDKVLTNTDRADMGGNRQQLAEDRRRPEQDKRQREQAKLSQRINLQASITTPTNDGEYTISIQTNADTASLKINGEEIGGSAGGSYAINRIARAGQDTKLDIIARDVYGNTDSKTIIVSRPVVESKASYASLNPVQVKRQPNRDAVAIIIGISNYKTLPKVEFANDDARIFYDYAIRALGVKPENIKLLVDSDAEEVEIIKAFKTWLPSHVKSTTDVYVYYSGHGLPTADGQGLYLLPPQADRDFISRTAIQFQEINADLQAAKPKSVTIFMDACYSGQARNGETLVANARPVMLKAEKKLFPDNFTVIAASQADQISSSSPDLKHGIFSYYLMKGMEGDADTNKDGKITLGEMQSYLVENVGRQAGMMSRKQEPQLIGDAGRILVGR